MIRILASIVVALALLLGYAMWAKSHAQAEAEKAVAAQDLAESTLAAVERARKSEQAKAKQLETIAAQYEQDKADAQDKASTVAAGVADGTLQLRMEWAGCRTQRLSDAAASASQSDGGAGDRAASAGRIIRAAAAADAQVRGLQAVVKADRQ